MNDGKFTLQAAVVWGVIPLAAKKRILANVFCVKCQGSAQMVDFTGKLEKHGDLILTGKCGVPMVLMKLLVPDGLRRKTKNSASTRSSRFNVDDATTEYFSSHRVILLL